MLSNISRLRVYAISQSLFQPTTLRGAIDRLRFVQADPIRSPARAQDLILRHRVNDYRAGDLERYYASLDLEEDFLYAYGFFPRDVWQLLHPRSATRLPALERKVLDAVRDRGTIHPKELEAHFGSRRIINGWGGYSKATKRALERLHYRGLLRVAGRENGIRIYEAAIAPAHTPAQEAATPLEPMTPPESMTPKDRFQKLVLVTAKILAPIPEKTLLSLTARLRRELPGALDHRRVLRELLGAGQLEQLSCDGITYIWPASASVPGVDETRNWVDENRLQQVRFLAPFDPLVWDRARFEHLWQWSYRFEAYTPPAKRIRGYYAMPLLWRDRVIGWANAAVAGGKLNVELGFVDKRPRDCEFRSEIEAEIARLEVFLNLEHNSSVDASD